MLVVVLDIVGVTEKYAYCGFWYCGKVLTNIVYLVAIVVVEVVEIPINDNCSCGDPRTLTPKTSVMHIFSKTLMENRQSTKKVFFVSCF